MTDQTLSRRCSYCFQTKPASEFSDEHIWPDALGGDPVGGPWRTDKVCGRCNSLSGQFVDGEFIKSWFVSHERAESALDFLDPAKPDKAVLPLTYMGPFSDPALKSDEVAEFWLGPCGAHIVHIRPKDEPHWDVYAGGRPAKKKGEWGSAFLTLTSQERLWIIASVLSFHKHFRHAERSVVNMSTPKGFSPPFRPVDPADGEQARRLDVARRAQDGVHVHVNVRRDLGTRFLAKLALGVGREVLGETFLDTRYADILRQALWERSLERRQALPVRGLGYLASREDMGLRMLHWPGAWVLAVLKDAETLSLHITSPSGKPMTVLVSDDVPIVGALQATSEDSEVFIALPALGQALGPVSISDYLAHKLGAVEHAELRALGAARRDPSLLPSCR